MLRICTGAPEILLAQLERHGAYLHLRASRNIDDRAAADTDDRIDNASDRLIAAVGTGLRALGGAAFAKDAAVNPVLNRGACKKMPVICAVVP